MSEELAVRCTCAARSTAHVDWIERAALSASLLCLIHCLALPLIVAALPVLASVLDIPEVIHLWILAFAIPAAGAALLSGWAQHRVRYPLVVGAAGLVLLAVGALVFPLQPAEVPVTVAGSIALAVAHLANWQLRRGGRPA